MKLNQAFFRNLQWKLALFCINHVSTGWLCYIKSLINYHKRPVSFLTICKDELLVTDTDTTNRHAFYFIVILLSWYWVPLFTVSWFCVDSYYKQFPETLI